jgi:hypothetical protein
MLGAARGAGWSSCQRQQKQAWVSLKGVWNEIFEFWFFSCFSVHPAHEYSIRAVSNFSKIRGDIRKWMFTAGVFFLHGPSPSPPTPPPTP